MKTLVAALAIAGSLIASHEAARAATYNFQFTAQGEDVHGSLTTSTTGASQLITGLNATFNGATATLAAPGAIGLSPTNDNLLFPGGTQTGLEGGRTGYLDGGGLAFNSGTGLYNVYFDNTNDYAFYKNGAGSATFGGSFTLSQVTAVSAAPEPGTWVLMLGGAGMLGAAMRIAQARRREDEVKGIATA